MVTNKTPVMILQELAVKFNKPLEFQLIYQDPVNCHMPIFKYAVLFTDKRVVGEGRSKKEAKHNSARLMLERLKDDKSYTGEGTVPIPPVESPQSTSLQRNAIGILADLCVEYNLQEPTYVEISDVGPPHAREFTYVCQVGHFKVQATSTTKKRAKQDAANKMLLRLTESLPESPANEMPPADSNLLSILPSEEAVNELFQQYETLTQYPKKPKNFSRLLKDDIFVLKKIREEKGITLQELNEQFLSKETSLGNLVNLLNKLNISAILKVVEEDPCIMSITLDTDPELFFIGLGSSFEVAKENVIKETFDMMAIFLK